MRSQINEFWRKYKHEQQVRRRKRQREFDLDYPEFERQLEEAGFNCKKGEHNIVIKRDKKFIAVLYPVPHNIAYFRGKNIPSFLDSQGGWRRFIQIVIESNPVREDSNG